MAQKRYSDSLSIKGKSVLVIGAGVGGMATAARLAAKGAVVDVYEASATSGGKLRSFSQDGFVFDLGPSLLTMPAVVRELFTSTGKPIDEVLELLPVEPGFHYRFSDGATAQLPGADPSMVADALGSALGGNAAQDWRKLMSRAGEVWQLTRKPVLQSPISSWVDLAKLAKSPRAIATIAPWQSLRSLGKSYFTDSRMVQFLDRYATYSGSDPRRAPAALVATPYIEQTFGAWHIRGGVSRLANALQTRCEELGVRFHFNQPVTSINANDEKIIGVTTGTGDSIQSEYVISNIDSLLTYQLTKGSYLAQQEQRRLRRLTPSFSGFAMALALRGRTPNIAHHNVLFNSNYDQEFDSLFKDPTRPTSDPTIYICAPDDPTMRPDEKHESWFVLVNAPAHDPSGKDGVNWVDDQVRNQYADRVLGLMAERGHDVRDRILWRKVISPADLATQTNTPGGAIYGPANHGSRATFLRATNRSPVEGLFLVGGSAHPGGGLPLVLFSAAITANLVSPGAFVTQ